MAQLQSTNVTGVLCVNGVAVGGGKDFKFCCFTTSGNWTPTSDLVDGGGSVEVLAVAGGGGGGAGAVRNQGYPGCKAIFAQGGGGGGGEVLHKYKTITSTDACCHVIGAGGIRGCACAASPTANSFVCPSAKGGNTTFLGETSFGGGGGASIACVTSDNCNISDETNRLGGPVGGRSCFFSCSSYGSGFQFCLPKTPRPGSSTFSHPKAIGVGFKGNAAYAEYVCDFDSDTIDTSTAADGGTGTTCAGRSCHFPGDGYGPLHFGAGGGVQYGPKPPMVSSCGVGGMGSCQTAALRPACPRVDGSAGNPGIIVLKWAE